MNRKYFSASLLLILLLLVMPFSLGGCSKDSPKRAVKKELNLIKELDESTIKAFVSYEDMMSSHSSSSDVGIETTEAVKRFFQNLNLFYPISKILSNILTFLQKLYIFKQTCK